MAIQHRRGSYVKFDPNKMVAGEWAVVQERDPEGKDGKGAYMAFAPGDARRIATSDELAAAKQETVAEVKPYADRAEAAADKASSSLEKCTIINVEINGSGHLIFATQNADGFDASITRPDGHLILEV